MDCPRISNRPLYVNVLYPSVSHSILGPPTICTAWTARRQRPREVAQVTAQEINGRLAAAKQEKIKVYPCRNLRASNIGHPCERYLYLLVTRWEDQRPHEPAPFTHGHVFHRPRLCFLPYGFVNALRFFQKPLETHTIKNLKEAGYEVITPTQWSFQIEKPLITAPCVCRRRAPACTLHTWPCLPPPPALLSPVWLCKCQGDLTV